MYDWNVPVRLPLEDAIEVDGLAADPVDAVDRELEAAIEYKLAVSGFAGVAEIVELVNRAVRRRWVMREWS